MCVECGSVDVREGNLGLPNLKSDIAEQRAKSREVSVGGEEGRGVCVPMLRVFCVENPVPGALTVPRLNAKESLHCLHRKLLHFSHPSPYTSAQDLHSPSCRAWRARQGGAVLGQ